jgi:hypothetical protein
MGDELLLLPFVHHEVESPYRAYDATNMMAAIPAKLFALSKRLRQIFR